MGPLATGEQLRRVERFVHEAALGGAQIAASGRRARVEGLDGGYFFRPTIVTGADHESRLAQEEVFGPMPAIFPFSGEDEAVELVNARRYGLAADVWTRDVKRAHRVAARLQAGTVWINMFAPALRTPPSAAIGTRGSDA